MKDDKVIISIADYEEYNNLKKLKEDDSFLEKTITYMKQYDSFYLNGFDRSHFSTLEVIYKGENELLKSFSKIINATQNNYIELIKKHKKLTSDYENLKIKLNKRWYQKLI